MSERKILKVKPPPDYPLEDGSYLRGNDYSPVAVVILLHTFYDKIPDFLKNLAKVAIEAGAALAGFLQTENIGIEKIVCNVVANPNIRYIVLCGVESAGHYPGETFVALMENGIDEKRRIVGTRAPTAYLYNIPTESVERFRKQVKLVNLIRDEDRILRVNPDTVKQAVRCCYQESPTQFLDYLLYDPGAFPEPPINAKITWRIDRPWTVTTEEEKLKLDQISKAAVEKTRRRIDDAELLSLLRPPKRQK